MEVAIQRFQRLAVIGETLRVALKGLALVLPDWPRSGVGADWWDRYRVRLENYRLPKDAQERQQWAFRTGQEGQKSPSC